VGSDGNLRQVSSSGRRALGSPDKMAKVQKGNNFQAGRMFGGDAEEPQDIMVREESLVPSKKEDETPGESANPA
jgi:hypothetical protein